ncbi:WecB/TagA/CpsF family glycosyltransferase [Paramagnetospirillum magneticum]|uniref:Teichoic acid biosynthesis protein n=1 Tax=Paramagnetospirillum magneticum (strain ATCC 700264 / AMB-1) TaxID=342108 RepID=Q2W7D2_PARM1|nr:WecB/TagA/CpsF family glycosyltransferase [Paramagnetospirillum magneticum]BAE50243.1 Teichoic acid biosynthesis protein [Paramagnetospirillum magneticum AMB-1]
MTHIPSILIAGVRVDSPSFAGTLDWTLNRITERSGGYICHLGAHGVVDAQQDAVLARALAGAALALPDGMPLVWLGRWLGLKSERVYGPDFMRSLLAATGDGRCRHFLFGSTPQVLRDLERRIRADYPGATIAGCLSPPFGPSSPEETEAHLHAIRNAGADVVWVGLGAPRQEKWMADVTARLPGILLFGVGAAFDFLSGTKPQAPAFVRRSGLEWAFRWLSEPRRLTSRYGRVIPVFLWLAARELWSRRQNRPV